MRALLRGATDAVAELLAALLQRALLRARVLAALAALPALSSLPQTPAPENLLPALEEIRIEGAEVLPELDQAMAQVEASIASVDTAGASLEPAPSKVADIQSAMGTAAAASAQDLDAA